MFIIIDVYTIILQLKNSDIESFDKVICTFIYKLKVL
jgi:hypothetical protein